MLAASGATSIADELFSQHVDIKSDELAPFREQFSIPNCKSIGSGIKHKGKSAASLFLILAVH
jgi:hypothetical protein